MQFTKILTLTRPKMKMEFLCCLLFILPLLFNSSVARNERVKLRDVRVLTFRNGEYTTYRRSKPMPQLKCVGGTANCNFIPTVVQCENKGSSYAPDDIQWKCSADMPKKYKFGTVDVSCEGYEYPEDKYILAGSCGLEFTIDYTSNDRGYSSDYNQGSYYQKNVKTQEGGGMFFVFVIIAAIIGIFLFCLPSQRSTGGSTGGHTSGFASAPPPPPPGFKSGYADGTSQDHSSTSSTTGGSNLWSGLMGAGLGYMLGRNSATRRQSYHDSNTYTYTRSSRSRSRTPDETRTATAYGGTKRR